MKRGGTLLIGFVLFCRNCWRPIVLMLLCVAVAALGSAADNSEKISASTKTTAAAAFQLPAYFEHNEGQFPATVNFVARMPGYTAWFTSDELILTTGNHTHTAKVRMRLIGSSGELIGADRLPGSVNYFVGSDPTKWRRGTPMYDRIERRHVYPGIDLVYRIARSELEYDLVVAPVTDPNRTKLQFEGAQSIRIDSAVDLVLSTAAGDIRQRKPTVYQDLPRRREPLDGHFVLEARDKVSFKVAVYDRSRALVIDPAIAYSTYLGGTTAVSAAHGIAQYTDALSGHVYVYVVGHTCATDFPTVSSLQDALAGATGECVYGYGPTFGPTADAFITKFDPSASGAVLVLYSTYLGGSGGDSASGVAIDFAGNAYITGTTESANFPLHNAYQTSLKYCNQYGCNSTPFLSKLSADGSALLYSTYVGGSGGDAAYAIALDAAGHAYIAGSTPSSDFPTRSAYQANRPGYASAFVAAFDTTQAGSASLLYSTYLGGAHDSFDFLDSAFALAVDPSGAVHVGGYTTSALFPVINGFQAEIAPCPPGCTPAAGFYAKLNPSASGAAQLVYSTYHGGGCFIGYEPRLGLFGTEAVQGLAVDSAGNAYRTGATCGNAFPLTLGAFQHGAGVGGTLVTKINPSLSGSSSLIYSGLGSVISDPYIAVPAQGGPISVAQGASISVDASGNAFVAGSAVPGLPLVNPAMFSSEGVYETIDAGQTWTGLTSSLTDLPITALAVDTSTSPRSLYAGTALGSVFASSDGGLNWNRVFQAPSTSTPNQCTRILWYTGPACVTSVVLDPTNLSNVYIGTNVGVYKSVDRGATWNPFNSGLSNIANQQGVMGLTFDGSTLYAGAGDGLYQLTQGASSWSTTTLAVDVHLITVDPTTTPHTIYTSSEIFDSVGAYRSIDGGRTWISIDGGGNQVFYPLAVDTSTSPAIVYASDICYYDTCGSAGLGVWKSVDHGNTWESVTDPGGNGEPGAYSYAVDTTQTPSILYYSAGQTFASRDKGQSWTTIRSDGSLVLSVDIISTGTSISPSILYAGRGVLGVPDAFVAELDPTGSNLLFCTYLDGIGFPTTSSAITIDAFDNIYVAGSTGSSYFPAPNGYQSAYPPAGLGGESIAFLTKLGNQGLPQSSSGSVNTQLGVSTGKLTVTLPNITGSTGSPWPHPDGDAALKHDDRKFRTNQQPRRIRHHDDCDLQRYRDPVLPGSYRE